MRLDVLPRVVSSSGDVNPKALTDALSKVAAQVNNLAEGQIVAANNAQAAVPSTGTYNVGDVIRNSAPAELGAVASKYVIFQWVCVVAGTPGTWRECRALTGN